MLSHFSHIQLCATPRIIACKAPLSMKLFRQEYWRGLPYPSPGDLPNPGIKPTSLTSTALAGRFFPTSAIWEVPNANFLAKWPFSQNSTSRILFDQTYPKKFRTPKLLYTKHKGKLFLCANGYCVPWSEKEWNHCNRRDSTQDNCFHLQLQGSI